MGGAKRMMEDREQKYSVAIGIAIEADVLEACSFHEDCIYEGGADIQEAYKLGNAKFSAGGLEAIFEDRRDMTDIIKEVVDDHMGSECPRCAKFRDE